MANRIRISVRFLVTSRYKRVVQKKDILHFET